MISDLDFLQRDFGLDLLTHFVLLPDVQCAVLVAKLHPVNHGLHKDLGGSSASLHHCTTGGLSRVGSTGQRGPDHHIRDFSTLRTSLGILWFDYFPIEPDFAVCFIFHRAVILSRRGEVDLDGISWFSLYNLDV